MVQVQHNGLYSPTFNNMNRWFRHVLKITCWGRSKNAYVLSVRLVGITEMSVLNRRYRGRLKPTNVLAFPMTASDAKGEVWLGDIVACPPVIAKESRKYNMPLNSRWMHILVHALLHLLGYQHNTAMDRHSMEKLEKRVLLHFGLTNPYLISDRKL